MSLPEKKSFLTSESFLWSEQAAMQALVLRLINTRLQFAVAPEPQDLRNAERTGWVVSYRDFRPTATEAA